MITNIKNHKTTVKVPPTTQLKEPPAVPFFQYNPSTRVGRKQAAYKDPEKAVISTISAKGLSASNILTSDRTIIHIRVCKMAFDSSSFKNNRSRLTDDAATSKTESSEDMAAENNTSKNRELSTGPSKLADPNK